MKRTTIALAIAAATVLSGPALAAQASTGHHDSRSSSRTESARERSLGDRDKHNHATCGGKCTPAPAPPAGGWPCQKTHSCKPPKTPHCPPTKPKPPTHQHPHKPPHHGTGNHHPRPPHKPSTPPTQVTPHTPVQDHPTKPHHRTHVIRHSSPAAPSTPNQLAMTGGVPWPLVFTGSGVLGLGSALYILAGVGGGSFRGHTKRMRDAIDTTASKAA